MIKYKIGSREVATELARIGGYHTTKEIAQYFGVSQQKASRLINSITRTKSIELDVKKLQQARGRQALSVKVIKVNNPTTNPPPIQKPRDNTRPAKNKHLLNHWLYGRPLPQEAHA